MKKKPFKMTRRQVLKAGMIGGAGLMLPLRFLPAKAFANACQGQACFILEDDGPPYTRCFNFNLSDPCLQPKFVELAPNALDPSFLFKDLNKNGGPDDKPNYSLSARDIVQETGLIDSKGRRLKTKLWGYGTDTHSWPGQTIQVKSTLYGGAPETVVRWENELQGKKHLLPVDTTLHWCYSLPGYDHYSIKKNGVPIITHLHGGHSDFQYDGNPEFFYSPDGKIKGPQWDNVESGFTNTFRYDNAVPAGNLWYHDHALGITRLNVYAGLAGFYFVRDDFDTGLPGNDADLPAFPYELAYAIQDRMFTNKGALFYPAFPGDPYYDGFITGEGAILPPDLFPGGGPTALAEFFGDHMVVNGKIWPKVDVEPRNYRMHLLNGTDSRFMALQFYEVPTGATDFSNANGPLNFTVIGSDQGLADSPTTHSTLLSEPGSRYDIIFDFKTVTFGKRVIMKNIGGDEPFGGTLTEGPGGDSELQIFDHTDKIMAFDVVVPKDNTVDDVAPTTLGFGPPTLGSYDRKRKVALFEGMDEFGRLQPLLGTAEPATDYGSGPGDTPQPINWPNEPVYVSAGLVGQMEGSIAWHSPTTENPKLGDVEEWEIFNVTGDAHPVHLHLVKFEILGRQEINFDTAADEDGFIPPTTPKTLATALTGATETEVVINGAIPALTPASGTIRVVDNGSNDRLLDYVSWTGSTFTLAEPADFTGTSASSGNDVFIPVADDDGAYLVPQPVVQHNGLLGNGFRIVFPSDPLDAYGSVVLQPSEYFEDAAKDMVTALPGQITRIKAKFDKPGRYVWHCHILSHEDHEMMRVLHVGPGA
jgi:FtsP/CotA-like multicopper oxidase with cupredoxin domain